MCALSSPVIVTEAGPGGADGQVLTDELDGSPENQSTIVVSREAEEDSYNEGET